MSFELESVLDKNCGRSTVVRLIVFLYSIAISFGRSTYRTVNILLLRKRKTRFSLASVFVFFSIFWACFVTRICKIGNIELNKFLFLYHAVRGTIRFFSEFETLS